jgi:hypothetical protein
MKKRSLLGGVCIDNITREGCARKSCNFNHDRILSKWAGKSLLVQLSAVHMGGAEDWKSRDSC